MPKEKIQKTVGVYERPEKKAMPWTAVVIVVAVVLVVAGAILFF